MADAIIETPTDLRVGAEVALLRADRATPAEAALRWRMWSAARLS